MFQNFHYFGMEGGRKDKLLILFSKNKSIMQFLFTLFLLVVHCFLFIYPVLIVLALLAIVRCADLYTSF